MLVCTWHAHVALPYWLMVREASVTLALYSSLPWVASSAAHVALPYWLMVREASVTLALYSSLP